MSTSDVLGESVLPGLFIETDDGVRLLAGECAGCSTLSFPAASVCANCQGRQVARRTLSASGRIHSYTVVRAQPPEYDGPVPYGLGFVDFAEGLRVYGPVFADDLNGLSIDSRVRTSTFEVGSPPRSTYCFVLDERP